MYNKKKFSYTNEEILDNFYSYKKLIIWKNA